MNLLTANQMMWIAFTVGSSAPIIFYVLYKYGYLSKRIFRLFIIGIGIGVGLLWEIPFGLTGFYL